MLKNLIDLKIGNALCKKMKKLNFTNALMNTKYNGFTCRVCGMVDGEHYRLIALDGTSEQLQKDKSFSENHECHEWSAIVTLNVCHCGKMFWFDDTSIPKGEKYELICTKCHMFLKREKM